MRLTNHLEDCSLLSDYLYGFRKHLSTQDVFLKLKEEVLSNIPTGGEHMVVALDLKSTFDTMSHTLILEELDRVECGEKMYNYIRSFLTDRKTTIGTENMRSDTFDMPGKGTPQGAILSPPLFNLGMNRLARRLEQIPDLKFSLYANYPVGDNRPSRVQRRGLTRSDRNCK